MEIIIKARFKCSKCREDFPTMEQAKAHEEEMKRFEKPFAFSRGDVVRILNTHHGQMSPGIIGVVVDSAIGRDRHRHWYDVFLPEYLRPDIINKAGLIGDYKEDELEIAEEYTIISSEKED